MKESTLGRTNRAFPRVWLKLKLGDRSETGETLQEFTVSAAALGLPMDISVAPALFGDFIPRIDQAVLAQVSATDFEKATDSKHAADLIQAHLIETLSCIGRPYIDFYFLRFRKTLEESQLSGIMEALESARHEEHVRYFGLYAENLGATLGNWQFHDAFDVISVPDTLKAEDRDTLRRMAHQRRAGFLIRTDRSDPSVEGADVAIVSVTDSRSVELIGRTL